MILNMPPIFHFAGVDYLQAEGQYLSTGRELAYIYWVGIASAAFLGTTKMTL